MINNSKLVASIIAILEGKGLGSLGNESFYMIHRIDGRYEVECGWAVPEAFDDDFRSHGRHPFKGGRQLPWVGRATVTDCPTEAADVYETYKAAVSKRQGSGLAGRTIGSVDRS